MREILIVTEGQTEQKFVSSILIPYFSEQGIYHIYPKTIRTSKDHYGGLVNYGRLKDDINRHMRSKNGAIITTFLDFYRVPESMPNYDECRRKRNVDERINCLISFLEEDTEVLNNNIFLPYLQKHEFEALLFSEITWAAAVLNTNGQNELQKVLNNFPNPENINEGNETAPSKRLINIFREHSSERYDKIIYGELISSQIGMDIMMEQCPGFANWINDIVKLANS